MSSSKRALLCSVLSRWNLNGWQSTEMGALRMLKLLEPAKIIRCPLAELKKSGL